MTIAGVDQTAGTGPPSFFAEWFGLIGKSPDVYPIQLDVSRNTAMLVKMSAAEYSHVSFLDARYIPAASRAISVPIPDLLLAANEIRTTVPMHFIFHTGHVGSTLVSRLIESVSKVLSLREPLPLRTLADMHDSLSASTSIQDDESFRTILLAMCRIWARGYAETEAAVVKASSSTARIAPVLLRESAHAKAIYLNLPVEEWLATLLAGEASIADLHGYAAQRWNRLQNIASSGAMPRVPATLGELAAMSWMVETANQIDLLQKFPQRVRAVDFGQFLQEVPEFMASICRHLGLAARAEDLANVVDSPWLGRYSKAPDHEYSAVTRAAILAESRRSMSQDISAGLRWLDHAAGVSTVLAGLLAASLSLSPHPH